MVVWKCSAWEIVLRHVQSRFIFVRGPWIQKSIRKTFKITWCQLRHLQKIPSFSYKDNARPHIARTIFDYLNDIRHPALVVATAQHILKSNRALLECSKRFVPRHVLPQWGCYYWSVLFSWNWKSFPKQISKKKYHAYPDEWKRL